MNGFLGGLSVGLMVGCGIGIIIMAILSFDSYYKSYKDGVKNR